MRVLLAIGQNDPRLALEILLSHEPGLSIVGTTGNIESLLALTQTSRPDLVVLDWDLPGRPEAKILIEAQNFAVRPHFVVLGRDPEGKQRALAAGAQAFVAIGDPPEQLLAAIRRARDCLFTRKRRGG